MLERNTLTLAKGDRVGDALVGVLDVCFCSAKMAQPRDKRHSYCFLLIAQCISYAEWAAAVVGGGDRRRLRG